MNSASNKRQILSREAFVSEMAKYTSEKPAVLCMILVKNLAWLNSQFGPEICDELIETFGQTLLDNPDFYLVGRVSPALYSLLSTDFEQPKKSIASLTQAIAELNRTSKFPFLIEISLGATVTDPKSGLGVDEWFVQANESMVASGRTGEPKIFKPSTVLEAKLRDILGRITKEDPVTEGMYWVYQPINYAVDGRIYAYEALCRWNVPGIGPVGPAVFIPIAEEMGAIEFIDRWGLMSLENRHEALFEHGGHCVSFNLSVKSLESDDSFADLVMQMLARNKDCGCELIIEMTETALVENRDRLLEQLDELRKHGVRISIDDFGSGMTSLGSLADIPCDYLKVDASIIRLKDQHKAKGLLAVSKKLANLLGAKVIVEGVETQAQLELVRASGAEFAQGWYFGQPLDPREDD